MTADLAQRRCEPCEGKTNAFSASEAAKYIAQVAGWQLSADAKSISRQFVTKNFMAAVKFIGKVAEVAEAENHHPDIHLTGYRKLTIELSTHAIGGLSENDFIVAAKINELPVELKKGG
jgi:4a-hydroxytetrahydrobiopterin dehydratase